MKASAGHGKQFHSYTGRRPVSMTAFCGFVAAVLGLVLFLIPGVRFSGILLLGVSFACFLWLILKRFAEFSRIARICKVIFLVGICCLMILLISLETMVIYNSGGDDPDAPVSAVIVLGAGVNGETPSLSLQTRIDAAAAYLKAHPHTPAVLSGGKGSGERISEAEAMCRGLMAQGISEDRLWLEDQSTNTAENFAFSVQVLAEHGVDSTDTIAVVTNDFHLYRAKLIAERNGMANPVGIPAELPWWLGVNYFIRESFATVKTLLFS